MIYFRTQDNAGVWMNSHSYWK